MPTAKSGAEFPALSRNFPGRRHLLVPGYAQRYARHATLASTSQAGVYYHG